MFNHSIITDVGSQLQEAWIEGTVLTFTGAACGVGVVPNDQMGAQTALKDQRQTMSITASEVVEGGIKLTLYVTSSGVSTDFKANQIGVFAKIGTDDPVLFALWQDGDGLPIPSQASMADFSFTMYATLHMSNTGEFTITVNPDELVSQEQLASALKSQQTTVVCLPKAGANAYSKHQILALSPIATVHAGSSGSKCFIGFAYEDAEVGTEKVSVITSGLIVGSVHVQTGGESINAGTRLYPLYISQAIGSVLSTSSTGAMPTERQIYLAEAIPADSGDVYTSASVWMF